MMHKVFVCVLLLGLSLEGISGQTSLDFPDEELQPVIEDDDFAIIDDDFRAASPNQNVQELSDYSPSDVDVEELELRKATESSHGSSHGNDHHGSSHGNDHHGSSHGNDHHGSSHNIELHGSSSGYDGLFPSSSTFGYGYPPTQYGYDVSPAFGFHGYEGIQQPYYGAPSRFGRYPRSTPSYIHGSRSPHRGYNLPSHGRHSHAGYGSAYAGYNSPAPYGGYGSLSRGYKYGGYGSRFAPGYGSRYGGYGSRFAPGYGGHGSRFAPGYGGHGSRFSGGYGSRYGGSGAYSRIFSHAKRY